MRCGATKPEGLPQQPNMISPNGEKVKQIKHKKVKWINEYRIDHITKLREHCSMLCVPCGRAKNVKRVQIASPCISSVTTSTCSVTPQPISPPNAIPQKHLVKILPQTHATSVVGSVTAVGTAPTEVMLSNTNSAGSKGAANPPTANKTNAAGTLPPPPPVVA